jgi:membrane associated rhomboid family serine protease
MQSQFSPSVPTLPLFCVLIPFHSVSLFSGMFIIIMIAIVIVIGAAIGVVGIVVGVAVAAAVAGVLSVLLALRLGLLRERIARAAASPCILN